VSAAIGIEDLGKVFTRKGESVEVLAHVDLQIERGSFVALVGRSGCGKSTLLNAIAGLIPATSGRITFDGTLAAYPRADVGYMTQKETLLPWRTVLQNVVMPLELAGIARTERESRARELLRVVGLAHAMQRYPRELSGGMQRRASLARMLARDPHILLLDEPFGALDAQIRADLQTELLRLWQGSQKTVLFVTHDIDEALMLADRAIVLREGGRIVLDRSVDFSRPRDLRVVRSEAAFGAMHDELHAAIGAEASAA
jgi:NitT/TauT family transport system ATP-binding protein